MKRESTISRRLMHRRAKRQPSEQRARIIRKQVEGSGVGAFGALGAWVSRVFGGR